MKLHNSYTNKVEEFIPIDGNKVKMYVCGPTVYDNAHLGHARCYITWDVLYRYLKFKGYDVTYCRNVTDVDDKILKKAEKEGKTPEQVSQYWYKQFENSMKALNTLKPDIEPFATKTLGEMISIVKDLIAKGYAYEADGDVYFRVKKFPQYGYLSKQPIDQLESGARIEVGEHKEDPLDFALWKKQKEGEPAWESPWGMGRPGWHIECSAMVNKYLGETIDIHSGGQDLIFPHHENEIAQSECANGKPFANYWMHNGYINVDNVKMSKSLGNFFTVRDVAEKYGYEPIRYLMISSQYRSPINYSVDIIEQCKASLQRLYTCRNNLDFALENATDIVPENAEEIKKQLDSRREQFIEAMDDDLNTADGISAVFELVKDINVNVIDSKSAELIKYAIDLFDELTNVLGLVYNRDTGSLDEEIEKLIEARQNARKEKNWAEADRIRDELKAQGIVLEDTPQGVKWHRE